MHVLLYTYATCSFCARAKALLEEHGVAFEELFPDRRRALSSSLLRLSRQGVTVAHHVEPDGDRFGRGSVLYFVSEGADLNTWGTEAVYCDPSGGLACKA